MNKSMKIFASLLLAAVLLLAGCSNDPSSNKAGWKDPSYDPSATMTTVDDWKDPGDDWKDPSYDPSATASTSDDWKDPGDDWKDPSYDPSATTTEPGAELISHTETEPSTTEPAKDGYRHEIDGWVFYTQHDINDYIGRDEYGEIFYASKMAKDVFGVDEVYSQYGEVSFIEYKNGMQNVMKLTYGKYTDNNERVTTSDGTWSGFSIYLGYAAIVKCRKDPGLRYLSIDGSARGACYEIIVLSLYICEHSVDEFGSGNNTWFWDLLYPNLSSRFRVIDRYGVQ